MSLPTIATALSAVNQILSTSGERSLPLSSPGLTECLQNHIVVVNVLCRPPGRPISGRDEDTHVSGQIAITLDDAAVILNSIADGVFTVNRDFIVTSFNRAAAGITGVPRDEALGRPCCEVFRAEICEADCALKHTIETGDTLVNRRVYILRPDGDRVPISISTALLRNARGDVIGGVETFRDLTFVEELRKEIEGRYTFADMISRSHLMQDIFAILPDIAESGSTVLIEGASGTGKELLARAIHRLSPRAEEPMVAVNCGALPDTLLESELFGYMAGAFTDAKKDKPGRFAQADGGTLFLDEIGDVSQALQVRLLRVLQEGTYEPLGSTRSCKADVRVIAATNKNLADEVEAGRFRQDLYYRVNVVRIALPALKARKEDLPLLVEKFIQRMNRLRGRDISGISQSALAVLMRHDWPGNVRELENAIEHSFVLCRSGLIEPQHLPEGLRPASPEPTPDTGQSLKQVEAQFIQDALKRNNWNRAATAKELGLHKTTLWRKIKRLGIELPDTDGRSAPHNAEAKPPP